MRTQRGELISTQCDWEQQRGDEIDRGNSCIVMAASEGISEDFLRISESEKEISELYQGDLSVAVLSKFFVVQSTWKFQQFTQS